MNETDVKKAAQQAEQLSSAIKDPTCRASAFGVLFDRFLSGDTVAPKSKTDSHYKAEARLPRKKTRLGPKDRLAELAKEGFFKTGKSLKEVLVELKNRGQGVDAGICGKGLQRLCQEKVLRRTKGKDSRGRSVYLYTNW